MKRCTGICNQVLALTAFGTKSAASDGLQYQCKACIRKKDREYRNNLTPEQRKRKRDQDRKWAQNNREKKRASNRKHSQKAETKKKTNARLRKRQREDPANKTLHNIRNGMNRVFKGTSKCASTKELLGCTLEQFNSHLEEQFQPGMSWDNQGKWQKDHIVPCASFDHDNPEHQRQCWHWSNFQPLWGRDNNRKNDKRIYNRVWDGAKWKYQYIPI